MKIAYLILAHDNPSHLKRLVNALTELDDHVFIHINKKSDFTLFESLSHQQNVTLISNRVSVYWGGFSMVQAVLNMLHAAREHPSPFQYYGLISGSDYPLRNNPYIHSYLEDRYPSEFIHTLDHHAIADSASIARLQYFVFEEGLVRRMTPLSLSLFYFNEKILKAKLMKRNYPKYLGGLEPYFGDAWWVLSDRAITYILDFVEAHPGLLSFYRHTTHPLEMFFHTIVGNSSLSKYMTDNFTYTDWDLPACSPLFLTDHHVDDFEKNFHQPEPLSGHRAFLFARKFAPDRHDLLDRIDQNLRGTSAKPNRSTGHSARVTR